MNHNAVIKYKKKIASCTRAMLEYLADTGTPEDTEYKMMKVEKEVYTTVVKDLQGVV